MAVFNQFPYTNFHELNQDWIIKTVKNAVVKTDATAESVAELTDYVKNFNGLPGVNKIVAIGDSYNAGWTPDGDVKGWGELLGEILDIGTNFINRYEGGMGFIREGNAGNTFQSVLEQVAEGIDPYTVKTIIVCGGSNDNGQSDSDLSAAIDAFFTYAKKTFVNAKIYIGCIGVMYTNPGSFVGMRSVAESYKKATVRNGGLYVTNSEYCLRWTGYIASDNLHINEEGQRAVAAMLYSTINGVSYTPTISNQTATATSEEFTGNISWVYNINNDIVNVKQDRPAALSFDTFNGTPSTTKLGRLNFVNPAIRSDGQYGQFNLTGFAYCLEGWVPCDILFMPTVDGSIDVFVSTDINSTYTTLKIPAFSVNIFML